MKIKRRHVKMARAAWRSANIYCADDYLYFAFFRWHAAARSIR